MTSLKIIPYFTNDVYGSKELGCLKVTMGAILINFPELRKGQCNSKIKEQEFPYLEGRRLNPGLPFYPDLTRLLERHHQVKPYKC